VLVSQKHKKLVLNLKEPDRVTGILPGAKVIDYKGSTLVAVPHTQESFKVLRNIGIQAPGPIKHYYEWPGLFPPFSHQRDTSEFVTLYQRAYILNDMGTGKTLSVLWAFDYLKKAGVLDWMLVLSPLSTLERTWADSAFEHLGELSVGVVYGTAQKRMKIASQEHDIYLINHDGIKNPQLLELFCRKAGNGLIVVDELAEYRHATTAKWKAANFLINGDAKKGYLRRDWAWGMTGTPIPQEPTDVYGQAKLITPASVPKYFGAFRDLTMRQLTPYKWIAKPDGLETAKRAMLPAIRFHRDECVDLPPTTYVDRQVEMTPEQEKAFNEMRGKMVTAYNGGRLTALNEVTMLSKLIQIACGVAYGPNGEEIEIPSHSRMNAVEEIVEQAAAKTIVFVPLVGALNALAAHLRKRWGVGVVHGGVSKAERDDIFHRFMVDPEMRVLVAVPSTMSHGITLTSANTVVWYAPVPAGIYQQANARVLRPGQKLNTLIVRLHAGTKVERERYKTLDRRTQTQVNFLDLF
jgi:SNF2 family DNA or RNA helicase